MTKVLVATEKPFAPVAVDGIRQVIEAAGFELILLENYTDPSEFLKSITDVEAVIIRSDIASKEVIAAGNNLKIIVRAGAGYDNIDLTPAKEKGVVAMNTPGQNSNAVAELALGMMVYFARGSFKGKSGYELRGKKLGIHAFGYVGQYVAEIAHGFGMELYGFDPYIPKEKMEKFGVKPVDNVADLYAKCHYISLHIPANKETKGSIGFDLLNSMPAPACLVNTARKEVINEAELLNIFETRKDFTYLSDIEPDCKAEFEEKYKGRYFFTPKKMGAQTEEANINAGIAAAHQIVAFLKNGDRTFQVNK